MGFEFRIAARLTPDQRQHVAQLLDALPQARRQHDGGAAWELRMAGNTGAMPDTGIALDAGGLYVCQYGAADAWHGLAALRGYLDAQGVAYAAEEVDD